MDDERSLRARIVQTPWSHRFHHAQGRQARHLARAYGFALAYLPRPRRRHRPRLRPRAAPVVPLARYRWATSGVGFRVERRLPSVYVLRVDGGNMALVGAEAARQWFETGQWVPEVEA